MVSDDARIRVRQDSWQFAACLNVLRDRRSPKWKYSRENSRKIEKTKFPPGYGRKNSSNCERKNSSTRPRGEKSPIVQGEKKDWNLTNYRKKVNDEIYSRNVKSYRSGDAYFSNNEIILNSNMPNNNCKIREDRGLDLTLRCNNDSFDLKEIKNCYPRTEGEKDSFDLNKTKNCSPITMGETNGKISNLHKSRVCSTSNKLQIIEKVTKFSFVVDSKNMYCVSCSLMFANTPQGHFEHYCDRDHKEKLARLERDHVVNNLLSGQLSKLDLFREYMEFSSESVVCCLACGREIDNIDDSVDLHMRDKLHVKMREKMHERAKRNFVLIKLGLLGGDWYKIQRYRCTDCKVSFEKEHDFFDHLENFNEHTSSLAHSRTSNEDESVYEFCSSCPLLSYGRRSLSGANHEDTPTHWMLLRHENYSCRELPQSAKSILANVEGCIEDRIEARKMLIRDVDKLVRVNYPLVKTRTFRSTIHAANSMNSDVDVFLDCRTMWHGRTPTKDQVWYFMRSVHSSVINDPESWKKKNFLAIGRFSGHRGSSPSNEPLVWDLLQ